MQPMGCLVLDGKINSVTGTAVQYPQMGSQECVPVLNAWPQLSALRPVTYPALLAVRWIDFC